jgi:hypothetical protein
VVEASIYTVSLRWSTPLEINGSGVRNYKIEQSCPGVRDSAVQIVTGNTDVDYTCTGLQPGTPYTFIVCAQNESGWGPWVRLPAFAVTKPAPPNEPVDLKVIRSMPMPFLYVKSRVCGK